MSAGAARQSQLAAEQRRNASVLDLKVDVWLQNSRQSSIALFLQSRKRLGLAHDTLQSQNNVALEDRTLQSQTEVAPKIHGRCLSVLPRHFRCMTFGCGTEFNAGD